MGRIYDTFIISASALLDIAFILAYEVGKTGDVYTYVFTPAVISGLIIALYTQDIKRILIIDILVISLVVIISSILLSLPAFIGVIPEDIVNPFLFISIKKALNNSILLILPLIVSTLIFGTIISGLKGE